MEFSDDPLWIQIRAPLAQSDFIEQLLLNPVIVEEGDFVDVYVPLLSGQSEEDIKALLPQGAFLKRLDSFSVDWEEQWTLFSPGYQEGFFYLNWEELGITSALPELKMKPGAGFGDLSHPTTRLMLRLMEKRVEGKKVLDIGCGSGVLTLASLAMKASYAWGVDIDLQAVIHAKENALENGFETSIFSSNEDWKGQKGLQVILLNMIRGEQKLAWDWFSGLEFPYDIVIASGVLLEEREGYLKEAGERGWTKVEEELEEEGWLGFVFSRNLMKH